MSTDDWEIYRQRKRAQDVYRAGDLDALRDALSIRPTFPTGDSRLPSEIIPSSHPASRIFGSWPDPERNMLRTLVPWSRTGDPVFGEVGSREE